MDTQDCVHSVFCSEYGQIYDKHTWQSCHIVNVFITANAERQRNSLLALNPAHNTTS